MYCQQPPKVSVIAMYIVYPNKVFKGQQVEEWSSKTVQTRKSLWGVSLYFTHSVLSTPCGILFTDGQIDRKTNDKNKTSESSTTDCNKGNNHFFNKGKQARQRKNTHTHLISHHTAGSKRKRANNT